MDTYVSLEEFRSDSNTEKDAFAEMEMTVEGNRQAQQQSQTERRLQIHFLWTCQRKKTRRYYYFTLLFCIHCCNL